MPRYLPIDGEQVSAEWLSVLTAMRRAGVVFNVNEGHRTLARQRYFWDLYRSGRGNLAAYPSPFAPHIRTGRIDHAIDFSNDGAVFAWLAKAGLQPRRTVRSESWHLEVPAGRLRWFHARHGSDPVLRKGSVNRDAIRRCQRLLRERGYRSVLVDGRYGLVTRHAVRRFQRKRGLPVDGICGPATWKALRRRI